MTSTRQPPVPPVPRASALDQALTVKVAIGLLVTALTVVAGPFVYLHGQGQELMVKVAKLEEGTVNTLSLIREVKEAAKDAGDAAKLDHEEIVRLRTELNSLAQRRK